jgi:hypothetical protein
MKCKKHPKYKAKRYPTSECPECLEIWNQKENFRKDPKRRGVYIEILNQRPDWKGL